ncbi:MAG: ATP synthase F1 subunit epsilon [Flavobacteriales bacterium]|nr:ATP synthase F1 subunit epsilon [Flavobacteriales bacterium]
MDLQIVTPDANLYSGEASMVEVPGTNGKFQVLNNHAPIISTLTKGQVRIKGADNKEQSFAIDGGVIEVLNNKVTVLAESA